jgi:hypothetical protein
MSRPLAREQVTQLLLEQQRVSTVEEKTKDRGFKVWVATRTCRAGTTSVHCSGQAPFVPKAAATHKHWFQKSKVYALDVFDRFKANACQLASASALGHGGSIFFGILMGMHVAVLHAGHLSHRRNSDIAANLANNLHSEHIF